MKGKGKRLSCATYAGRDVNERNGRGMGNGDVRPNMVSQFECFLLLLLKTLLASMKHQQMETFGEQINRYCA